MQLKASAPGSLMLLGEYAVLYGKHALVAAVDKRIHVLLTPLQEPVIQIDSDLFGTHETTLSALKIEKPYQFVLGTLQYYQAKLNYGCHISISSEFSDQVGLGSSAAITVAMLAALNLWLGIRIAPLDLVKQGRNVVRYIQTVGSGADIAASVYGGVLGYHTQPLVTEKFTHLHPLTVLYSGFKTPTVTAIQTVQQAFADHPTLFNHLTQTIGQCAFEGIQHMRQKTWDKLGKVMDIQQGLMTALGVNSLLMQHMVEDLRQQPNMLGAKISGSGLGDCVIGLGTVTNDYAFANGHIAAVKRIPVNMTLQGVMCEKI